MSLQLRKEADDELQPEEDVDGDQGERDQASGQKRKGRVCSGNNSGKKGGSWLGRAQSIENSGSKTIWSKTY